MFMLTHIKNEQSDLDPNYDYFKFDINITEEYCTPNDMSRLYELRKKYKLFPMDIAGTDLTVDYGSDTVKFTTEDDIFTGIPYYDEYGTYTVTVKAKKFTRLYIDPSSYEWSPISKIILFPKQVDESTYTFYNARYLTSLPSNYKLPTSNFYYDMFNGCTNLVADITNIWDNVSGVTLQDAYLITFYNCLNITGTAPANKLWNNSSLSESASQGMGTFYNCSNLTNYNDIPSKWKEYEV